MIKLWSNTQWQIQRFKQMALLRAVSTYAALRVALRGVASW